MAILARINYQLADALSDILKLFKKEDSVTISHYLDPRLITFLTATSRDEALEVLIGKLDRAGKLKDKEAFHRAILEREKIVSTGIGLGVAIPHAKCSGYEDFFIAIGIQKKQGIEWNALDGSLVRIVFMIGGPEDKQTEYLKILSRLTTAIKDEERRKKLLKVVTPQEVINLFHGC